MDYKAITNKYYSKWLGIDEQYMESTGVWAVQSEERGICQEGYERPFTVYMYVTEKNILISYAPSLERQVKQLVECIHVGMDIHQITSHVQVCVGDRPNHNVKFVFKALQDISTEGVMQLKVQDYDSYLAFFKTNNPNCKDVSWVREYFEEIVDQETCFGISVDGRLVSVTDAPGIPYMQGHVQEIGINTVAEYRGNGYAKQVSHACMQELINHNICPLWATAFGNIGSEKLAYSLGFERLADVLTICSD